MSHYSASEKGSVRVKYDCWTVWAKRAISYTARLQKVELWAGETAGDPRRGYTRPIGVMLQVCRKALETHKSLCLRALYDGCSPWAIPRLIRHPEAEALSEVWSAVTTGSSSDKEGGQGRKIEPGHRMTSGLQPLASNLAGPDVAPLLFPEKYC